MRPARIRQRSGSVVAGLATVILSLAVLLSASIAWAKDGDGGIDLKVTVLDSSASPSPTSTTSGTSSTSPSASPWRSSTANTTGAVTVPPSVAAPIPAPGAAGTTTGSTTGGPSGSSAAPTGTSSSDEALAGLLYVSGLGTSYRASVNPFSGSIEERFTVRNVSTASVNATATFWVTQVFAGGVGEPVSVNITDLKPGETRTISASIDGIGMWTLVGTHVTFTPPDTIGETPLSPVTRDSTVLALTWLHIVLAALIVGAIVLYRRHRRLARSTRPASLPSGGHA